MIELKKESSHQLEQRQEKYFAKWFEECVSSYLLFLCMLSIFVAFNNILFTYIDYVYILLLDAKIA